MGGLFGKKTQSTTPVRLNAIAVNQSAYGNCVPLLYGTSRLPITLIDYVDFKATPVSQSGGGKGGGGGGGTSSYNYSASIVGLLCEGSETGITGVTQVFLDKTQTTLAAENLVLFKGTGSQAPWAYMTSNHPDHADPYDHFAYIAGANFDLGSSAGLPNLTFEVQGLSLWQGVGPDAEPSQILNDYCLNQTHGVGFPYLVQPSQLADYQNYCVAMGFFISPQETNQRQAQDFIAEILKLTNSNAVFSAGVGLRIVPYADQAVTGNGATFTPNLTPIYSFNDSDYLYTEGQAPVQRSITPANETFNVWRVEYLSRANQYNTAIATYRDEQDVAVNGLRVAPTVNLHSITDGGTAMKVATLLCQRNLYIRSTFTFQVRSDYSLLEPMDLVAINDSLGGIVNQLVRITEVDDDENDLLTITAEEMMVGPASAPLYDLQLSEGFFANYGADPGSVAPPYIFTAPPLLVSATGGYEEWVAVAGRSGLWGGAVVYASLDDITYDHVGVVATPARVGHTLSALPVGADPDTANSFIVKFDNSTPLTLISGTRADADGLRTLCIIDGEVIAYQNVTPLGNNAFSLSYIRRGQYGSSIAAHAAGSFFAVIDKNIFRMPFDPGQSGQPVWFKFVSFNYYGGGHQDISAVPAYQAFFQGQNGGQLLPDGATPLIARGNIINVGSRLFKSGGVFAWDGNCYSADAFDAGCFLQFRPCQNNLSLMIGLNTTQVPAGAYQTINYAWYASADGNAYIYESGNLVFSTGIYDTNTIFRVQYDGKYVKYSRNGVLWRSVPAPGLVFFFNATFLSPGAAADNVSFGSLNPANSSPFIARGQCTVSDENAQKVGGNVAWDSDIYSLEGYPNCHVTWKCNDAVHDVMVGLGRSPGKDSSYASIDYAFDCASDGKWRITLSGANVSGMIGPYTSTTRFAIIFDTTAVAWLVDGVSVYSLAVAPGVLFLDSSFYTPGAGINTLQYGPTTQLQLADTAQLGINSATDIAQVAVGFFSTAGIGFPAPASNNIIASYDVSNYPFAVEINITTFGMVTYTPSGGTHQVAHQIVLSTGALEDQIAYNNPAGNFPLLAKTTLNIAANRGAFTLYSILGKAAAGDTCTISGATVSIEVVKR